MRFNISKGIIDNFLRNDILLEFDVFLHFVRKKSTLDLNFCVQMILNVK